MKLKGITATEKKIRHDFALPESEAARLEQYRDFVSTAGGAKVSTRELLALIVVQFMDEDKDFAKALAAQGRAMPLQPSHGILRGNVEAQ